MLHAIGGVGTWSPVLVTALAACTGRHEAKPLRVVIDSMPRPATAADLPPVAPGAPVVRIGFTGDLMQNRQQAHDDFRRSYAEVAPTLRSFDLTVGNLEFPVDSTLPAGPDPGTLRFNGLTSHLDAIAGAGFDVLQTANNHCFDRGLLGMQRTLDAVEGRGMRPVGTARSIEALRAAPLLLDVKGLRLAFRAYTFPPNVQFDSLGRRIQPHDLPVFVLHFENWRDQNRVHGQALFRDHAVQARRGGAAFLVALVHWGKEYYARPTADQREAAHDLVDAGFDLVVGTHSHVLNGAEVYRGKLIAYSMGNFLSPGRILESRTGAVLEVRVAAASPRGPAAVTGFSYRPVFLRLPDHVVVLLDSAAGPAQAAAWGYARLVLGSSIAR